MKIIQNGKIDLQILKNCIAKPKIYEKSTAKFWDDEYISQQMLKYHLDPDIEAASKTREAIEAETSFIVKWTDMDDKKAVVDLGCGPGLYVKEFAKTGAKITGIDYSDRSINYANEFVKAVYENTNFLLMNYLNLNYSQTFDIATLIFYDFCVLNPTEQKHLLAKIHTALKDNGLFIFDVLSDQRKTLVTTKMSICEGGFWNSEPYIEIYNTFWYENVKTEGMQYTIIAEDGATRIIRLYHRMFGLAEIINLLSENHFKIEKVYKNLKGEPLSDDSETFGIFARKV